MSSIRILLRILPFSARTKLGGLALCTTVAGFIELLGIGLIIPFIAFAANMSPFGISSSITQKLVAGLVSLGIPHESLTLALGVVFLAGISISNVTLCLYQYYALKIVYSERADLSLRVADAISRRNISWYDTQNSAELSKNVMADVSWSVEYINAAVQIFAILVRGLVIYFFFLYVQPRLALLTAVMLGSSYFGVFRFIHKPLIRAGKQAFDVDSLLFRLCSELVGGARELKVTNTSAFIVKDLGEVANKAVHPQIMRGMPGFVTRAVLETLTVASVIGLLIYYNSKDGNLANGLPMLSAYALAGIRLIPAVQQGLYFAVQMKFYIPSIERVAKLLEDTEHLEPRSSDSAPITFNNSISLSHIFYAYSAQAPMIQDICLCINKKQRVAFVGETGAGKSTVVDLLLGLRFPQKGTFLVDDQAITLANSLSWRRLVGYVPQVIYLRDSSLIENVAFGIPKNQIDKLRVERACRAASLNEFIDSQPQGYETQVGERGVRLSGGQCQRIGIARALYHDPAVVIFDEATSSLDTVTEGLVLEAMESLRGEKTLIVIAHRLNTVWDFDQIFVLEQGKLVGKGTSSELLESCPTFARLAANHRTLVAEVPGLVVCADHTF